MTNRIAAGWLKFLENWNGRTLSAQASSPAAINATTLEDRVLYSATPLLDPSLDANSAQVNSNDSPVQPTDLIDLLPEELVPIPATTVAANSDVASDLPATVHHELVLIDSRIDELDQLVQSFLAREDATHDVEIVYLDPTQDGFAQVDSALAGDTKFDAVHFVTHGADGMIRLGGSWLDATTIEQRLDQIQGWADSLSQDADLLFYGCDFAADEAGQEVVDRLSEITGADVAASDDATGTATRGGDWTLEYATGVIDAQMTFDESLAGWEHLLATYVVTTTADSGAGSLRQAITDANNNAGADTISFNIGSGAATITLTTTVLPTITDQVTIDGWTQGGWSSTPLIVIDGNDRTGNGLTLSSTADGSIIRGLIIRNIAGDGIEIQAGSINNLIVGNYIGNLSTGGASAGANLENTQSGIQIFGANNTVGGTLATERNVISGNSAQGIFIDGASASGNLVSGNYIGLDASGTIILANGTDGVFIGNSASNNTIGGPSAAYRNVISGNSDDGVQIGVTGSANNNTVRYNYVGTDYTGTVALGNSADGVDVDNGGLNSTISDNLISGNLSDGIDLGDAGSSTGTIIRGNMIGVQSDGVSALGNTGHGILIGNGGTANNTIIGGTAASMANTIAYNGGDGIAIVGTTTNVSILRNSIYNNTGTGIDLGNNGITLNDIGDSDTGANTLLNTPMLGSAVTSGTGTNFTGTLALGANTTYRIEFFSNPYGTADSGGYGEARTYLGSVSVTTNSAGRASFDTTISNLTLSAGATVTATATVDLGGGSFGSTSELAGNILADNPNLFVTGSYTGNGSDNRSILGLGFRPEVVIVVQRNSGQVGVIRTSLMAGDVSKPLSGGTGLTANLIQTLEGDGFTIGTDGRVNTNGTTYDYMAFGAGSDIQIGAYTGNGTSQSIAGIGFQPELTFFMAGNTNSARFNSSLSVTNTFNFDNSTSGTNGVTAYGSDGFTVSSGGAVNGSSVTIYYVAFNQSAQYFTQASYTGNGTDNRNITGVGFSPEMVFVRQLASSANWVPFKLDSTGPSTDFVSYMDSSGTWADVIQSLQSDGFQVGTEHEVNKTGDVFGYFAFKQRDILYAPVNTIPTAQTTNEETNRVFSSGNGNQISIADADAGTSSLQVTLSVTNGTLTLASTTGLTLTSGDGTADATMIFAGSLTNINNALNGLIYAPTSDYAGGATLTIASRDATLYSLDIDTGLVGRYTFEGNANDVAPGTAQNGTTVNGATYTTDAVRGQVLSLDGVNDFVQISSVFSNPTEITIGGWVNLLSGTGRKEFISLDDRVHIALDDAGGVKGTIQTGAGAWLDLNSSQFISGTGWHHVMFTFSDTDNYLRLYIDGVQVASTTTTSSIYWTGATTTYIGRHPTATINFPNALVDDVRIYNRAITADEVAHLARDLALVATDSVAISVNPVNDAPTAAITPTTYAVNEQATLTLHGTGLSIADNDAASSSVRATLSVVSGTISVAAGSTGATISGSGTNTVTITGTITQINNVLAGASSATVTYTLNSDAPPGSDTLTLTANDQGNTGSGGALTASDTATINITALNDAPTAVITPTTYAVNEQATLTLHGTGLSIADIDAASSTVRATLSVVSGTISATAGTTGVTVAGSGTNTVTLTGTLTQINNLLAGNLSSTLTYTINSDAPPASDTLTLTANDQGNTGSGGALTANDTATINITALNDAPTAAITPLTYSVNEQATLTLHGTGLSIADVDSASSTVRATLSVVSGTISATAGTTGVTVAGSGTNTVTLTGTLTQINNLLAGNLSATLTYTINSDTPPASDTLTLTANDQGNTGSGGALTASDTATINITALNDAPTATITPTSYGVNEQVGALLSGTGLSIGDVDAASGTMSVTLSVGEGTLTVAAGSTGASVSNSGTSTVTITGTVTQVNNLLAGNSGASVSYIDNIDTPSASTTLTMTVNDQGNTGSGGALTATDTATINITAINDAPTSTITPTTYSVNEQATLTLHGTGLAIADVDAASGTMSVTLSVGEGTLSVAAGSTGASVSNSGTSTVTITGTVTQINNLLAGSLSGTVTYTNTTDTPSASTTLTMTVNDQGNTGSGGALTANDTATINITALNDAPTATISPLTYSVNEQATLTLHGTGLSIADVDAASSTVQATLSVVSGTISAAAGTTGVTIAGSGTNTVTLTGTLTQINNLLAGNLSATLTYTINSDTPPASDTLTLTANDQGNTGSGGALTANDTATINITALNDAPTSTITPATYSVNEQATLTLHGTGLSIADVDAASGTMSVTLSVGEGTLTVTAGSTGATVSNSGTSTVTITGTFTQINNLLAGNSSATVTYIDNIDAPSASTTLTMTVNDQGNTGSGGALTANDTATINITALNDAPTATITPTTYSVNEQATLTLHGTGLSITDADAASGTMSVTLSVGEGTLTVTAGSTGATVNNSGTSTVTITGTVTQINNVLAGSSSATVTYTNNIDTPSASTTLTMTVDDQGNSGSGGALTANDTATINITAVNDAPTATITPTTYSVNEQATLTLHGTGLSIGDVDAASGTMSVTLSVGAGTLTVAAGSTGASVSNSGTSSVTITGTVTQINNLLAGNLSATVTYIDNTDAPSASTTLTLSVNDQGNTGSGGALTALDTATINITALNDAPTATITPTTYAVNEQATLTLHGTGLSIADVDAASSTVQATLSVVSGTISAAAGTTGVTISGSGTNTVTLTGTLTQINNLLAGNLSATLTYTINSDTPPASDTLTLTANDQGNTGSGGALTANDTATINITALNDAPTSTITSTTYTVNEQATLTLHGTGLSIADVDAASGTMSVTLAVGEGTLTVTAGSTGATVSNSGTSNVTVTGTVTQINNLLAGNSSATVTYTNNTDTPSASTTLTMTVNDQGNTGSGGSLTANDTATINITALNDAPTATITPTTYAVNEQATLTLHGTGLSIADVDAASSTVQATLSVVSGTISAAAGTTGVTISGSGTNTVTLTGTLTQINNLLAGNLSATLTYTINSDTPPASDTLTLTANDQGNTGSGGSLTANDTATINITALNDAPTATITPTTYTVNEQTTLTLHGTGLAIGDVDAASGTMSVTLSVGEGNLTVTAGSTGATVSNSGTSTVTITGTVTQINNVLAGNSSATFTYINPLSSPAPSTTLTMTVNDQGNTGTGGSLTATDTATINITSINTEPTTGNTGGSTGEDTAYAALTLTGSDIDGTVANFRLSSLPANGTLYLDAGLTTPVTTGVDYAASSEALTLYFVPNANWNGATSFQYVAVDNQGLADSTPATGSITITPVDDAPTASSGTVTLAGVAEDTASPTGASVASLFGSAFNDSTDQVSGGSSAHNLAGIAITANSAVAATQGTWQYFNGTSWTNISTAVSTTSALVLDASTQVRFLANADYNGTPGTLTARLIDDSTGAVTTGSTVNVTTSGGTTQFSNVGNAVTLDTSISAVNDTPTATITPTTYSVNEQATLTLHGTGLSIADVDAASGTMSVTLSVGEGTLTVTAGTTGATVSNSGTSTVTITGTVTQINNVLAGNNTATVTYTDNTNTPSASTTLTMSVNDQGNTGSGGAMTTLDTATINITALNDAPTATITPTTYSVNEQATLTLHGTGLSIADVDAASSTVKATLTVVSGTISAAAGTTGVTVSGSGTNTITLTGTVAQINDLLAGNLSSTLTYTINSDTPVASDTLTLTANDQGNTGSGGALTANDTATINITALNDAPTATITPTTYSVNEQATLTLHGTGLAIADVDASSGTMSVTLSVVEGTLNVAAGSTGATVSNSGTSTVTITGTVTQINNLLAGNLSGTVTYTNNTNTPSASTVLTLSVNDQGNTGAGGALASSDTATINITALNDAPTATITPTTYSINEQATLTLHGTGLAITDVDAASGTMSVTLAVGTGTLTVTAGSTGATVSNSGTSTVTITGTVTQINDLLAGNLSGTVTYTDNTDTPSASTTLTMSVNDQGNTGSGGALTASDTATINITALNDAPTATITPTTYSVNEQATLTLHGTGLSIADVDAASSTVRATLSVVSGTISATGGNTGVTVSGSGTNTVTLTGTLTQINNLLAGNLSSTLTYTLNSNTPPASDTLTLTANDQGNTGSGGALTANDTATINITAINDAPTATITPTTYAVNEQATLTLHGTGLAIADVDAASGTMSVTLSVGEGTLTVNAGTTGATVSNSGTSSVTITGTVTQINNLLAGSLSGTVTYTNNTDTPSASTVLTLSVDDQGNTGSGGALTASDTATINITALNDAPTATITPASYTTNEQTTLTLHGTGLVVNDVDAASGTLQVTLSVTEGRVNLTAGATGVTIAGSDTATATITGTLSQINDVLAGNNGATLTYYNQKNNPAPSVVLTMTANDQGNTGSGGALTATDTVLINIVAFNNAPVTDSVSTSAAEDNASTAITLTGSDVDGTIASFQLTSLPTDGTLYLDAGLTTLAATGVDYVATSDQRTFYFVPNANWNGATTFQYFSTDDLGQTDPASATGTITITATNDAPTANTGSVSLAGVAEDTASPAGATVSSLFGSAFDDSLDQISGGSSANSLAGIAITANSAVSATQGRWQYFNGASWTNISTAVSTSSALVLNASTQIRFLANADYNGTPGTLTVRLIDDSAGAVTNGTTVNVTTSGGTTRFSNVGNAIVLNTTISAVNDAPTATITPGSYTVSEQVTLNLHGTGLSIGDIDAASGTMSVTLSVGEGTLTVTAGSTGATVSNSGTSTVTITGTVTQINNVLAGNSTATVTYIDNTDTPSASTTLTLSVNDQGNTGSGGALTAVDTATINITAVNDAPTASISPGSYAVNEQTTLALAGTGLSIADVDAGGSTMKVTLSVGSGALTVNVGTTGATVSGSGTATVTLTGTATQLNDLLAGNASGTIDYLNSSDTPSASTTLTMTVNDQGNTGSGGSLTATDTATINITALNDAPTATITPVSYTVNEQTTLTLDGTGLSIADVDASGAVVTATLTVGEGTLSASAGSTGATVSGSGTNTLTLTGTVTQINNLLAGSGPAFVRYIDNTDAPGTSTTLTLTVNDQGNTGVGGALLGSDTATINLVNVNDAPVIVNNTFSLLENSANTTLVGLVPVTDPDLGDTHTYSITAGNTSGAFSIDNTGALVVLNVGALDFELIPVFTLTVRVQDAAGAFDTATIIVNLLNVNESAVGPVSDTNAATNQVNENSLIGTTVGLTANATDGDTLDLITYSLDDSAGGLFAVNVLTGVVTVAGSLDAETAQSHTIIVRATSSDTSYSTQSFTINVRDVNETPIGAVSDVDATTDEVAENSTIGTTVGVTAFADDTDVTATVSYSLTNSAGGRFAIDAATGVITVAGALDAETATSYTITARALSSDGSTSSRSFTINILDVNETPATAISDTNAATNQVNENSAVGATVGLTAFADDTDVVDTISYSLDDDAGGLFTINASTGVVTVAGALDAEAATSQTIIVRATSTDTSYTIRSFTINILDVNEVPIGPTSDVDVTTDEVAENSAIGTAVGVTAFAVDGDVTATVSYTLTNSAGGRFAINAATGVITVAGAIDAETATSYTVTARATSSDGSFSTQSFTINILDVNESPTTAISDTNVATNQVAENSAIGTTVGITALADDLDVTDTISYSLDKDAGGLFTIDSLTGVVTVAGALDAETATSQTIIVRATSTDTSFTIRSFTINILDVNEFATTPVVDTNAATDEVTENSAIGTTVGVTTLATDGDVTDTVSYTLDDSAGGLFSIDSTTGVITVAGAIDYETAHSYTVIVRATSTDTSFTTQSFTINVLDVNDNPPTIDLDGDNSSGATGLDYDTIFTEDAGPVAIGDVDLTINDPDSPIINSVVITITNRLDGVQELLAADTTGTSITAVYAGGTLTLSGADTLAHYQQVLQTVTYTNLSDNANLTDRVITFQSSDGTLTGPVATTTVHLVGMPDAPTLTAPGLLSATEDTILVLTSTTGGTGFVADVDSGTLTVTITATSGSLTLATTAGLSFSTGDGLNDTTLTFTGTQADVNAAMEGMSFTPVQDFNGLASIAWSVRDPSNLSAIGTTTIDVSAVNDAPTITGPTTINTDEDTPAVFSTALGNALQVSDVDVGLVQVTLSATNGLLSLASLNGLTFVVGDGLGDATVTFTGTVSDVNTALDGLAFAPSADYHGAAAIQTFVDDLGNTGTGGALTDSLTTNISIASINDAPVGVNDTINTRNIDTILITTAGFLTNDTDVDGDSLSAVLLTNPTHGTLVASGGGAWLYVPDATYFGNDTFTYIATDGQLSSQPITVTIVISIAGGPNSGGAAQSAGALGGVISSALITSATKDESTAVVVTQHFSAASIVIEREAVNEAPIGPLQNNQNQQLTTIEARSLDSESLANTAFRSALLVRPETSVRMADTSITRLLTSTTMYTPFNVGTMNTMLDGLRDQVEMRWESMSISTGSVAVTAVGLTAGYALWALRGAHLVATLLTTMPAWWSIDPLPILTATQAMKMRDEDHEETLADIASSRKQPSKT
jgi:hypothetical protein